MIACKDREPFSKPLALRSRDEILPVQGMNMGLTAWWCSSSISHVNFTGPFCPGTSSERTQNYFAWNCSVVNGCYDMGVLLWWPPVYLLGWASLPSIYNLIQYLTIATNLPEGRIILEHFSPTDGDLMRHCVGYFFAEKDFSKTHYPQKTPCYAVQSIHLAAAWPDSLCTVERYYMKFCGGKVLAAVLICGECFKISLPFDALATK